MSTRYGQWTIIYDPPPIPDRRFDWRFVHDDYDGAPDAWHGGYDPRHGQAASLYAAKDAIEALEQELRDEEREREFEWALRHFALKAQLQASLEVA